MSPRRSKAQKLPNLTAAFAGRRVVRRAPMPAAVIALDPDKTNTAITWARLVEGEERAYQLVELLGGGSGEPVGWSSITGARAWLSSKGLDNKRTLVAVESQPANSPFSVDVEGLRRVRYHWDAACELIGCRCVHVDKSAWQSFVLAGRKVKGKGAIKRLYQREADETLAVHVNEDQATALHILRWQIDQLGGELIIDGFVKSP